MLVSEIKLRFKDSVWKKKTKQHLFLKKKKW